MKRFCFLILLLLSFLGSDPRAENLNQYGCSGQKGIIFAWNGSWDLGEGSFEGGIGYKHWLSDNWAAKSFISYAKDDIRFDNPFHPEVWTRQESFSLLVGAENHFWHYNRLSFYLGGCVQFTNSTNKYHEDEYPEPVFESRSHMHIWDFQLSIGPEYFISKKLSLSGQYQIDLSRAKESGRNVDVGTTWNLGTSTSLLMLTVYF